MTLGARSLLDEWGSPLAVARALLEGKVKSWDQEFAREACGGEFMLIAARHQLELAQQSKGKKHPTHPK